MISKWFFILAVNIFILVNLASGKEWRQKNIGNSDGLSNSAVNCVYMDSKGYVWMGTWDGLNRYDGDNVKVFKPNVFEEGNISNNIIRDIFEDKQNNLWVVTEDGLNMFDYRTEKFTSFLTGINTIDYRENRFHAFMDKDSNVWCNIYNYGLSRFDYQKEAFTKPLMAKGHPDLFSKAAGIAFGSDHLWVLSRNGKVLKVGIEHMNVREVFRIPENKAANLSQNWFKEYQNDMLIFTVLENGGLLQVNPGEKSLKTYHTKKPALNVTSLSKSLDGSSFWGGTDDGNVFKLFPEAKQLEFLEQKLAQFSNQQIKIWTVTETEPDLLWIGTDGNGVYRFIMENNFFSSYSKGLSNQKRLNHNIVRAIHEDKRGNVWVGTRGAGINIIPKGNQPTSVINTTDGLSNNAVLALAEDENENIWVGTDSQGVDMIEKNSGRILHFPDDFINPPPIDFGYVYAVVFDSFGDLWIGTSGYGLLRFTVEKQGAGKYSLKSYDHYKSEQENGLQSNIVYAIAEGEPNIMWIGTRGSGLYRLNKITGEFSAFSSDPENQNSLNNNDVLSLYNSTNQVLWIGTSGGLNRMDMSTSPYSFSHLTENNGLPNNTVHSILEDSNKNIWVSTNKGLARINMTDSTMRNYLKSDGLQNNEFTDGAADYGKQSERFYFGGVNGVDWFDPHQIKDSDYFPRLAITGFSLLGSDSGNTTYLTDESIDEADSLTLRHDQNFFRFSFTALNYHNKEKTRYKYSLTGQDNEFQLEDTGDEATFTNIPPGKYLFTINWTNENGIWHPENRKIHITVLPPFWQTSWAYAIYGLLFIALMFWLGYSIRNKIKRRHKITIDRLEFEKIKEMNQYKFQFFTNIAHEFRTPLTLIMAPAARLMDIKTGHEELKPYLKSIYNNSTRLLHLIRELIDFRKVETGKFTLKVTHDNISSFLNTIKSAFDQYAKQKNISLKLIAGEEPIYGWFDNRILEKIMLNLISNAIKYSFNGGEVIVKLRQEGDYVRISVKDTGKGISEKYQNKIFDRFFQQAESLPYEKGRTESAGVGLSLTKSLIELHKGNIHLESIPGQGSNFMVSIPVKEEYYSETEKSVEMVIDETKIKDRAEEEFIGDEEIQFLSEPIHTEKTKQTLETVLVVDDNTQIRSLIADILHPDYVILTAKNGLEALEIIKKQEVSVIISDVIMPDMDGLELTRNIKENPVTSHLPVILLTAKGELEHRIEGIESGADSYIPKPFDPRHLKVRVRKLIETRNKLQKLIQSKGLTGHVKVPGLSCRDADFMKKIYDLIEKNIDNEELDADTIAAEVFISKTQLYRKVKAITGYTPHGLIKSIRLKKAADILLNGNLTVSEIIYETGFKNRTYFYRSFKEMFGDSPLDYAKKHQSY